MGDKEGQLYEVTRKAKSIVARVMHQGKVIDGKYYSKGWVEIVSGVANEHYRIDPTIFPKGHDVPDKMKQELIEVNGWSERDWIEMFGDEAA